MKKKRRWLCFLVALFLFFPFVSRAETAEDTEQTPSAWELLPAETREQLSALGITEESLESTTTLQADSAFSWLIETLGAELSDPLTLGATMLGAVLLCALLDSLRHLSDHAGIRSVFHAVTALTVSAVLLTSLSTALLRAEEAAESSTVFLSGLVPVHATLLATSGRLTAAISYQSSVLWISELLSLLVSQTVMPLLLIALSLCTVGSVFPDWRLQNLGGGICRTCGWGMGLIGTFFTGLLSMQTIAASATDTLSGRALRFSVAHLIPMVGGALSDALLTLQGCLTAVRSTVGVFGIITVTGILLPPILSCFGWNVVLSLCGYVAEVFALDTVVVLTRSAATVMKTVLAVLVMCGVFLIVAITVLMKTGVTV
ncbi:MAG: hypothetical protein IJE00_03960 [Clostridia bacterium]|nr:hypothetical protein [Clostridia bacterium]